MSEHGGRYAGLAGDLNRAGFVVWAHDHRGHGLNPTPPVGLGHFADSDGWRKLTDDAWAVSSEMLATFAGLPLVLFAHSMGSFLAQDLIAARGTVYRMVVLSGTNGPPDASEAAVRGLAHAQRLLLGARHPGTWVTTAVFGTYNRRFAPNRTAFDWLSRDQQEVDAYVADPLCGVPLTAQSWLDFLSARSTLTGADHVKRIPKALPIHVIAGGADPVGGELRGVERLLRVYQDAGFARITNQFYDGARHELVNETNRAEVTRDLISRLADLRV
jgi:alpha-beta hydrolase superfamily lysophospholipase